MVVDFVYKVRARTFDVRRDGRVEQPTNNFSRVEGIIASDLPHLSAKAFGRGLLKVP